MKNNKVMIDNKQPYQVGLFKEVTNEFYTNSFAFYELLPKYFVARGKNAIKLNSDGTVKPMIRFFTVKNINYKMMISPAYIETKNGIVAKFPGVTEEIIEFVLYKLAIEDGYMLDNETGEKGFSLVTSIYRIAQELKKYNRTRSVSEIKESLTILSNTNYNLKAENSSIEELNFRPIADSGFKQFYIDGDEKRSDVAFFIRFNSLVNTALLSREWHQINYDYIMSHNSFLGRYILKHLQLSLRNAGQGVYQELKLSTIIERSGVALNSNMTTMKKNVLKILNELNYFIQTPVEFRDKKILNPDTKRRTLSDVVFKLVPTESFSKTQILNNVQNKKNNMHRVSSDGLLIKDPSQLEFKNFKERQQAQALFDSAEEIE